jgi:hypothetical protein
MAARSEDQCHAANDGQPCINSFHLYPVTKGVRLPLAKLFDLQAGRLVMGTSLGDKITIVIALLLLAVGGVMIVEFPGIIRAARLVATL